MLCSSGFGNVWYSQGTANTTGFIQAFKDRLLDMFRQEWSYRISESTRARFFNAVVPVHGFSEFLDTVNVKCHRIALTRLICSSHSLRVETGRWENPKLPLQDRICENCNKLGDEYHFLFECELFTDARNRLIPRYYRVRPSMHKCVELLSSTNKKALRNLAKYVWIAFKNY